MTDASLHSATAMLSGTRFNIEVRAICAQTESGPRVTYYVTSFERNGQPAEMTSTATLNGVFQSLEARADSGAPFRVTQSNPRFNNQISTEQSRVVVERAGGFSSEPAGVHLARASRVVFRLFLLTGDETIEFSQQDDALRQVLNPCLQELARNQQAEEQRQAQRRAEEQRLQTQQAEERQLREQQSEEEGRRRQQAEEQRLRDQRLTHEQRERQEQSELCEQIRRSGTTNEEYLRLQGCQ